MAENEPILSDLAVEAFGDIVGLSPDDEDFAGYVDHIQKFAAQCQTLHALSLQNHDVPALNFRPPLRTNLERRYSPSPMRDPMRRRGISQTSLFSPRVNCPRSFVPVHSPRSS